MCVPLCCDIITVYPHHDYYIANYTKILLVQLNVTSMTTTIMSYFDKYINAMQTVILNVGLRPTIENLTYIVSRNIEMCIIYTFY